MHRFFAAPALASVVLLGCGSPAPVAPAVAHSAAPPVAPAPLAGRVEASVAPPGSGATQLDCGDFHTCARVADGTVRCWGRNDHGQLGDGTTEDRPQPVAPAGVRGVAEIAAGSTYSCARLDSGGVQCWGSGRMLGDGETRTNALPSTVTGLGGVLEIRAAGLVTCARRDGGARCWGLSGDRARAATSTDLAELGRPVELATASAHACGRQGDGKVRCWGDFAWTAGAAARFVKPPIEGARRLITGDDFLCAVVAGGAVRCWGRNDSGQLGTTPDGEVHATPLEIAGVGPAERLAAGEGQACAILQDGAVRCWGANEEGELGLGTRSTTELPQATLKELGPVRDLCIGSSHACALTAAGEVHCWGQNAAGQVGDGTKERAVTPRRVRGL